MCGMAAFKEHCVFGYWKAPLGAGRGGRRGQRDGLSRQDHSKRRLSAPLPSKTAFQAHVKKAMALNEAGVTVERPAKARKPEVGPYRPISRPR